MDLETFLKAEKLVNRIREIENQHIEYQELINGAIEGITLITKNGEMRITNNSIVNGITYNIDSYFFGEAEQLKLQLEGI